MRFLIACCFALLACASTATAQTVRSERPALQAGATELVVASHKTGATYQVEVTRPSMPVALPGQRFPVVYALDRGHGLVGQTGRLLGDVASMDPAYFVSIGQLPQDQDSRDRDMLHRPSQRDGTPIGGGGAAFQAFLLEELRPLLEARFPLDPNRSVLFGHSLSGLFTATLLSERPDAFSAYVIASPSANYDAEIVSRVAAVASKGGGRRVFLAVGGAEGERMRTQVTRLQEVLAAPSSTFRVETRVFEGEGHSNYYPQLVPVAFARVLPRTLPTPVQRPIAVDPNILPRYAGTYRLSDGRTYRVTVDERGLTGELDGLPARRLTPDAPNRFFVRGVEVVVSFDDAAAGPSPGIKLSLYGYETAAIRVR